MTTYRGKKNTAGRRVLTVLLALIIAGVVFFGSMLGIVLAGSRDEVRSDAVHAVVVLGCQVMPSGQPSILLRDRLDKALDYLEDQPEAVIVVSGGQGGNEPTSEAQCMYDYLVAHGVSPERILREDRSRNTDQNLRNTIELLAEEGYDPTGEIAVVSNGFHLARVRMLWARASGGQNNLSTLAAPSTHAPSRLMMYLREPLALVKSFLFDRR